MKDDLGLGNIDKSFKKIDNDFKKIFGDPYKNKHTFGKIRGGKSGKVSMKTNKITKKDIQKAKQTAKEIDKTLKAIRTFINKHRGEKSPNLEKMTDDEILALEKRIEGIEKKQILVKRAKERITEYYEYQKQKRELKKKMRNEKIKHVIKRIFRIHRRKKDPSLEQEETEV